MPKRMRTWNENKYRKYLAEGRGQGEFSEYVPWVQIQDFPSKGIVSRVKLDIFQQKYPKNKMYLINLNSVLLSLNKE